jgi:hypothetical protein
VFGFSTGNQLGGSELQAVAQSFVTLVVAQYLPFVSRTVNFEVVRAFDYLHPRQYASEWSFPSGTTGAVDDEGTPMNVTIPVKLKTGRSGRSYRGRVELFGVPKREVQGDALSQSIQQSAKDFIGSVRAYAGDGHVTGLCIVSRKLGIATLVNSHVVSITTGSMRSRLNTHD